MMTDRPIPFTAPMVRALLEGRKTMTRRVLKPQPSPDFIGATIDADGLTVQPAFLFGSDTHKALRRIPRPRGGLWVREAWRTDPGLDHLSGKKIEAACLEADYLRAWAPIVYEADGMAVHGVGRYRHARFMPRWASRITLIVTDVRVQRLQEISEEDAWAEGITPPSETMTMAEAAAICSRYKTDHAGIAVYASLWDSINAKRGYGWDTNPWVVAYTFRTILANIDSLSEAA